MPQNREEGRADCVTQEQSIVEGRADLKPRADERCFFYILSSLLSFYSAWKRVFSWDAVIEDPSGLRPSGVGLRLKMGRSHHLKISLVTSIWNRNEINLGKANWWQCSENHGLRKTVWNKTQFKTISNGLKSVKVMTFLAKTQCARSSLPIRHPPLLVPLWQVENVIAQSGYPAIYDHLTK